MKQATHLLVVFLIIGSAATSGVVFVGSTSAAAPSDLVQNGGFENYSNNFDSGKDSEQVVAGSDAIDGWRVSSGNVDQVGKYWPPQDGSVSIVESSDQPDTTAPNVNIDQPTEGATLTTTDVALNVSANESGNWTYSVDGGNNQTATGANGTQTLNVTLSGLADGSHTATVYIEDGGGNVDTDTVSFTVSTASSLTTSPGSVTNTTASGGYFVDDKLTVTDPDGGSIDNATASIGQGFDSSSDELSVNTTLANNRNITSTYNDTTGVLNLSANSSATVTAEDFQAVLRTVTYNFTGGSTSNGTERTVPIRFTLDANREQVTAYDGHYYEFVSDSVSWKTAKRDAENRSHLGLQGYLATLTSQEEDDEIHTKSRTSYRIPVSRGSVRPTRTQRVTGPGSLVQRTGRYSGKMGLRRMVNMLGGVSASQTMMETANTTPKSRMVVGTMVLRLLIMATSSNTAA